MRIDCAKTSRATTAWLISLGLCGVTVLAVLPVCAADVPSPTPPVPSPAPSPSPVPSPVPSPTPTPVPVPPSPEPETTPAPDPSLSPDSEDAPGKAEPLTEEEKKEEKARKQKEVMERNRQQTRGNSLGRYLPSWTGRLFDNVYVSGGTSISSRFFNVSGSQAAQSTYRESVNAQGFGTRQVGPFQQNMDLTISGRVLDAFTIDGRFSNTRQNNYFNQVFGLNYRAKGTSFNLGDVSAALPGNEFVTFSRTVRGLSFGRDFGNGVRVQGVGSYTQAVARRGTFQGNGTRGPFPLQSSSILEGSERVQLNGVDMLAGQDYQIDYLFGQITFLSGRIVNPEDTVVYTYEAQNFNSSPGLLTGTRIDLTPKAAPYAMGITWLQQKQLSGNQGVAEITERFPVNNDLGYQYQLASGIETGTPVEVRYLDERLVENIDFQLVRGSRFFRLLRKFPPDTAFNATLSLSIKYRPVRQSSITGDRSIMGLDGNYRVSNTTNLAWQYGRSQNTVKGADGGDAMSLNATFGGGGRSGIGGWNSTLGWRNIGSTYAGIDSTSAAFMRAEKGLRGTLSYRPTSFLSLTTSMNESQIGSQTTASAADGSQSSAFNWSKNTQWQGGFSLSVPKMPRLDFSHSQVSQGTQGGTGSRSNYGSDQLNLNYQIGMLGMSGSFGRSVSRGQSVFSSGFTNALSGTQSTSGSVLDEIRGGSYNTNSATDSSSDTGRLNLSLTPAPWIQMSGALGVSRTRYGSTGTSGASGSVSNARDNSFGVRLPVRENLSFGMDWSESTNGRGNTQTGSQTGSGIASQRTRTTSFDTRYVPRDNLELSFQFGRTLFLIPGIDNTDSNNTGFGLMYSPVQDITFFGNYSSQKLKYLGSQSGTSDDTTFQFQATAGPFNRVGGAFGKMTFSAGYQRVNTGSALSSSVYNGDGSDLIGTSPSNGSLGLGGILRSVSRQVRDATFSQQQQRLSLWNVRADYPIASRQSLYLSWQAIDSFSPLAGDNAGTSYYSASNYRRGNGAVGYDFRLSELVTMTANWNLIQMNDNERSDQSYRARAFNMDLSAKF